MATAAHEPVQGNGPKPEPCLSPDQELVLSEGLLAIAEEIHNQPEAEAHSLSHWFTWLDEEGYDQPGIARALQQLCQQRLGAEAGQQLQAQAKARADDPQGVPSAIEHLSQNHPELLEELLAIEQTRQEELQRLHAMAGGISKYGKVGIPVVGFSLGLAYFIYKERQTTKLINKMKANLVRQAPNITGRESATSFLEHNMEITITKKIEKTYYEVQNMKYEDLISEGSHKLAVPLNTMSPSDIKLQAEILSGKFVKAASHYDKSPVAAELQATILRLRKPKVYLAEFNNWMQLKEKEVSADATHEASDILRESRTEFSDVTHDIYKNINDIPRDLRKEFHRSEYIQQRLIGDIKGETNGRIHFFQTLVEKDIHSTLQANHAELKAAVDRGADLSSYEKINNSIDFDFTDAGIKLAYSKNGEAALAKYSKEYLCEAVIARGGLSIDEIFVNRNPLIIEAKQLLNNPKLDKTLKVNLRRQLTKTSEIEPLIQQIYIDDRAELFSQILKTTDNTIKNQLENELDDPLIWFDKSIDKNIAIVDHWIEGEACKSFQGALNAAKDSLKAAERDAGGAGRIIEDS